jgi:maltose O-acetyltransferase
MGRLSAVLHEEFGDARPRLHVALMISGLLPPFVGNRARAAVLRLGGLQIGRGTVVFGRMTVTGSAHPANTVRIGRWCWLNRGCFIDASAQVTIADRVAIGHDVMILTSTHEVGPPVRRASEMVLAPVTIGEGAWIGARAVVLPGVSIGEGAVVGAGAVVTRDVPANTVVGGVPAQQLRRLDGDPGVDLAGAPAGAVDEQPDESAISWRPILTSLRAESRT